MLNLNCVICAELFSQSDDVYVTTCGHMFHHQCLMQWLQRSQTCPQCRNKCTTRNVTRVYFNLANLDVSRIDVGTLQEQLDNANLALKIKEKDTKKLDQQIKDLKDTQKKCMKTIAGLEQKMQKNEFVMSSYVEQIKVLKSDSQVLDSLRKENKSLKQQIHTMEGVSAMLDANSAEVERLLKNESNPHVLANWVATLKRELRQSETKKTELRNIIRVVQHDLRKELEIKRTMEERISHLESDLYQAQEKIESKASSASDSLNNSVGLNQNILALKKGEKRTTISPTTKENIKRIEESTSPYLNIKSSSVGLSHLLASKAKLSPTKGSRGILSGPHATTGAIRKTTSDLSEKYSIFKKPRLNLGSLSTGLHAGTSSNLVFNGVGGSEKPDPFAQRDEEERQQDSEVQPQLLSKNINSRLKAGALRNFKLGK
ncbi:E3 ubiquitin-protein ligase TRAIP [Drosophila tropicalis]|uniref:E3 ubiquitin-protein ligase TRAIP n=1 Tax=Drosophila tropicalis TaxID=46794 RepID=UPI0035ABDA23